MAHTKPTPPTPGLTGYHCIECMKEGLKHHRQFWAGVEAGYWDEQGYTRAGAEPRRRKMPLRFVDYTGRWRVIAQFQFEPRDLWLGLFWRISGPPEWPIYHLYICLIPCCPLHITCGRWQKV